LPPGPAGIGRGLFVCWSRPRRLRTREQAMRTDETDTPSPNRPAARALAGLTVRARKPVDCHGIAALWELPRVRWGTLRLPYVSADEVRKMMERSPDGHVSIVAVLDGRLVGSAGLFPAKGRGALAGGS